MIINYQISCIYWLIPDFYPSSNFYEASPHRMDPLDKWTNKQTNGHVSLLVRLCLRWSLTLIGFLLFSGLRCYRSWWMAPWRRGWLVAWKIVGEKELSKIIGYMRDKDESGKIWKCGGNFNQIFKYR